MTSKKIASSDMCEKVREGGGFMVRRAIDKHNIVDPFLMLDHVGPVVYGPGEAIGAPDHGHRGFETVTYLIDGQTFHQDSQGNCGTLSSGWCQWMTAGSGVVHSEMPSKAFLESGGKFEGFQLFVNLPKKFKWATPRYQDTPPEKLPIVKSPDGMTSVKIIAGEQLGHSANIETRIPIMYLDVHVTKGAKYDVSIPPNYNTCFYVWRGSGFMGPERLPSSDGQTVRLTEEGDYFTIEGAPDSDIHVLVLGGVPIKEPIAWQSGFVMNTQEELEQTIKDYKDGVLGQIEGAEERRATNRAAVEQSKKAGSY